MLLLLRLLFIERINIEFQLFFYSLLVLVDLVQQYFICNMFVWLSFFKLVLVDFGKVVDIMEVLW